MKILHITPSYKPAYIYGGPIQSVAKLCEALMAICDERLAVGDKCEEAIGIAEKSSFDSAQDDRHLEVEVITTTANGETELEVSTGEPVLVEGVAVTYYKRWTKDHSHFSPGLLMGLRKVLRHFVKLSAGLAQDDKHHAHGDRLIIHIHGWWNLVSVLSCCVAKWYGVPVVLSPRGMLAAYTQNNRHSIIKKFLHHLIGKKLLQYCHIHATSEQEKNDILEIIKPESIAVIPNLVNLTSETFSIKYQVSSRHQFESASFKLIFLSRIEEKKGLELLFDALSLLDIDWQLTIAGSGKDEYVESLKLKAQHLQLNQHINWIGQVSDQDKYKLMADHDLLVLTSYNENFANIVIESLSVGTPVLVSDQVGLSDYVNKQQLGWVCKLDLTDIKTKLSSAAHSQEKRENIKQLAPVIIRNDFNDQTLTKRYLEFYKSLPH